MAEWDQVQRSFAGGEVSGRMIMRNDWGGHRESVLRMENYMPTLQGTAVRAPGSRYLQTVTGLDARIIPYRTPTNKQAIVQITPATGEGLNDGTLSILEDLPEALGTARSGPVQFNTTQPRDPIINTNPNYLLGYEGWLVLPVVYPVKNGELGWSDRQNGALIGTARAGSSPNEPAIGLAQSTALIQNTDRLNIQLSFAYADNFSGPDAKFTLKFAAGTTPQADDLWSQEYDETSLTVGQRIDINETLTGLSLLDGSNVHLSVALTAIGTGSKPSTPLLVMFNYRLRARYQLTAAATDIATVPYLASELQDLQFVQSPYPDTDLTGSIVGIGKELVITHPKHPPYWLRDNGTAYEFVAIPFKDSGAIDFTPDAWEDGNYPAACSSLTGRLVLAGSADSIVASTIYGSSSETVWCSGVGQWDILFDPNYNYVDGITAASPMRFTAIYRSPIKWVFGQKTLLIGAQEMEYIASTDGIYQPSDIGVHMHSTHGSSAVQPAGMGDAVMFPAEAGTKLRQMSFNNDDGGYVAPDMNLFHPELFRSGIVRIVRLRNPQQMTVVVMGNGQVALLHNDKNAGISGWSRLNLNAGVKDACVIPDESGRDILFLTVQRFLGGEPILHLEAIANWTDGGEWDYLQSNVFQVVDNASLIEGLDHLEGKNVQVLGDGNYLGVYKVASGLIELRDQIGQEIKVSQALVGLSMTSRIATMPVVDGDPGLTKRYAAIKVRGVFSSRPLINGQRPPDRTPTTPMNISEPLDLIEDYKVANLGADDFQQVTIEENVPVRSEIIGIFGKIKGSSV